MSSMTQKSDVTLNARVGAIAILTGAGGVGVLALAPIILAPLTLLSIGLATFGIWALCDEMGMGKPLVRAAFVTFVLATGAKTLAMLNISSADIGRYYVFYAFSILIALLLWSVAFLHRQRDVKIAGAVGALAAITPIVLLIVGHVVVGVGGIFGVTALFAVAEGSPQTRYVAIDNVDLIFAVWAIVASTMLWTGRIRTME